MSASSGVKKQSKRNGKGKGKGKSHITCDNCQKPTHLKDQCWAPGGDKEGQGPNQQKAKKKNESANIVKNNDADELFAFSCTSDLNALVTKLKINKCTHNTILDSRASRHFCHDRSRFQSYQPIDRDIKTVDGQTLKAIGTGNVQIILPNRNKTTPVVPKECIHAPDLAFTLISVS
jgi:hypothetical protein